MTNPNMPHFLDAASAWRRINPATIPSTLEIPHEFSAAVQIAHRIMDIGCGTGSAVAALRNTSVEAWVGLDVNLGALAAANQMTDSWAKFAAQDARKPLRVAGKFDLLLFKGMLTCLPTRREQQKVLRNALEHTTSRRLVIIADFLQNWDHPVYQRRYEDGQRLGLERGTFVVPGDTTEEPLYLAHHFDHEELLQILRDVGLRLISYRATPVCTRSGNEIKGFVVAAS